MRKATLTTLFSLLLLFSLTACWGGNKKADTQKNNSTASYNSALERNGVPKGRSDSNTDANTAYEDYQNKQSYAPDGKTLGEDLNTAAKKIADGTKDVANDTAGAVRDTGRTLKNGMRDAGEDVQGAVKNTQRDVTSMLDKTINAR